jgi:hypothetical protein
MYFQVDVKPLQQRYEAFVNEDVQRGVRKMSSDQTNGGQHAYQIAKAGQFNDADGLYQSRQEWTYFLTPGEKPQKSYHNLCQHSATPDVIGEYGRK